MQINSNLVLRRATPNDSAREIAKCIYQTDPYIYPAFCESEDDNDWVSLIEKCLLDEGNLFFFENLFVGELEGRIVAVACIIPCGKKIGFLDKNLIPPPLLAGAEKVEKGYFIPLFEDNQALTSGRNLVNLCVDKDYRSRGIGKALLRYLLILYEEEPFYLDVIANNAVALNLYRSLGFSPLKEYSGFSADENLLPCLHMKREVQKL